MVLGVMAQEAVPFQAQVAVARPQEPVAELRREPPAPCRVGFCFWVSPAPFAGRDRVYSKAWSGIS